MAVVLVLGLAPISNSYATSSSDAESGQAIEQQAESPSKDVSDSGSKSDSSADSSGKDASGSDSSDTDSKSADSSSAKSGKAAADEDSNSDSGDSTEGTPGGKSENGESQSGESGISVASDNDANDSTSGTYNPDADFTDISEHCTPSSALYKDADHTTPLDDTAITANETFYAKMTVQFQDGYRPTLSNPNVKYQFPDTLKVADMPETNLEDNGKIAGTWYIKDNVVYFKYNEDYLKDTVVHAYANINCSLGGVDKGDGDSVTITFPGSSTSITVNTKDGSVDGSKFGGNMNEQWNGPTYDQATNSYTWTIKVTPSAHATDLKISDTIGNNLSFVEDSFTLVDAQGNPVSGKCDATVNGQNASISLGDLSAGTYYVQYKTTVNSLPSADNTDISNASNKAEFTWGSTTEGKKNLGEKSPQSAKYSMVSKSADGSSTPTMIKWVVKLNNGNIKADMGGYTFTDTVDSDQKFVSSTGVTITDPDGNKVTPTDTSLTDSSLSFKLPDTAGEKQYTVTYYTTMTDTSSKDAVSNTAKVTPPDPEHGPSGEGTGKYTQPDTGTYITKTLTGDIDSASYAGKASWKSEILFSDMAANTSASSIVFTDEFSNLPSNVKVSLAGDVTLAIDGGATLLEGTDYTITKASGEQWANNKLFTITFKDTDTVKNLIGKDGAKVAVTYSTLTTQDGGVYPTGTYKNKSTVKTDKKSSISAEASYTIEREAEPPAVIKDGTSSSWDADYEWSDGTKGAWITDWTAHVNRTGEHDYEYVGAVDLKQKDVVVKDTLPKDTVVNGTVSYELKTGHWNTVATGKATVSTTGDIATITVPTSAATGKVYVVLTYQTATKGSLDSKETITNTAQAESGSYKFPSGSGKAEFNNKALSKTGEQVSGSSARKYTITVNENAYDLVSGADKLTLVDDLDYRGQLAASTISVRSDSGIDLLASGQADYSLSTVASGGNTHTRLTLTVPDSMKVIVSYQVLPSGDKGDEMKDFSNSCQLSGIKSSELDLVQTFVVAASSGGTASESWGIDITKSDSSGKKNLEGAVFELHKVDLDKSTKENIVEEKVAEGTTDAKGKVSFGTEEEPLSTNTLYYFVETKAPAGYEISYTGNTYVMLKSAATQSDYQAAYDKAVALGLTPSSSRSYSAFDELEKGSFNLEIEKKVVGAEAPAGAQFTFKAEATGDNAASAPKLSDVVVTTTDKGVQTYTGSFTGSLSDSMNGQTFTYKVSETASAAGGWTYDSGTYTATVQVAEQDGKLVGNVSYAKDDTTADKMSFTNIYTTSGTPVLNAKKIVNGGKANSKFKDKYFTFGVYHADSEGHRTGDLIQYIKFTPSDNYAFFNWQEKYTESGTHAYVIHEEGTPEAGWAFADDVLVTVTATDNGQGKLNLSYKYSTATEDGTKALFDNTYTESTSATLQAKKILTGRDMSNDEFSFDLIDQNEGDHKGEVIDTKASTASRSGDPVTVTFGSLSFDQPGTYTYGIQEEVGTLAHVTYDTSVYTAQVVVTKDDATGKLSAEVHYLKDAEELATGEVPAFNNTYTAPATGEFQLKAMKTVNGATPKAGEKFTFTVMYESGYEGGKQVADIIEDATTDDTGVATFGTATLGEEFYGKSFMLRIHEKDQLGEGWTPAADVFATVSVSQPTGTEKPVVTVKYNKEETQYASFDNTYSTSTNATLKVSKTVTGATDAVKDKEFTFALYEKGSDEVLQTVKAKAGETVFFANALEFTQAGTYEYDIKELGSNGDGWTYGDPTTATVKVVENADRSLSATTSYARATDDGTAAQFTNAYATSGSAQLQVYKTVNGGTEAKAGEKFTFDLYKADGYSVSDDGVVTGTKLGTVETEAGKVANFDSLTYDAEGTYSYVIHEVGHSGKGWTSAPDVTATVKASDNGDGTLKTEISYSDTKQGAAAFNDTYTSAGELVLDVAKIVNHGNLSPDEEFEFGLFETDESGAKIGDPIATVKLKAGETKSLDGVFYDFDNDGQTYTYIISELTELGESWTKAADQKVIVKVSDDGQGGMNTEVSYEGGGTAALFDNTYTEPEKPVTPTEESKKEKKSSSKKSKSSESEKESTAKTGDDTLFAAGAASAIAIAAAGASVLARRRRND